MRLLIFLVGFIIVTFIFVHLSRFIRRGKIIIFHIRLLFMRSNVFQCCVIVGISGLNLLIVYSIFNEVFPQERITEIRCPL